MGALPGFRDLFSPLEETMSKARQDLSDLPFGKICLSILSLRSGL